MPRRITESPGLPKKGQTSLGHHGGRVPARVLPINRQINPCKETLESILSTVLRSEDNELDQILRALSDLSDIVKSQNFDSAAINEALKKLQCGPSRNPCSIAKSGLWQLRMT
jgi:hypothetical protein